MSSFLLTNSLPQKYKNFLSLSFFFVLKFQHENVFGYTPSKSIPVETVYLRMTWQNLPGFLRVYFLDDNIIQNVWKVYVFLCEKM